MERTEGSRSIRFYHLIESTRIYGYVSHELRRRSVDFTDDAAVSDDPRRPASVSATRLEQLAEADCRGYGRSRRGYRYPRLRGFLVQVRRTGQAGDQGEAEGKGGVRAVSRALAILRAFRLEQPALALAEIAASAGLNRPTTRRMLLTLIEEGLVRQDPIGQRYSLTLRVLELAAAAPTGGLREEARPVMIRLAKETGATVFLSVPGTHGALCIERVMGDDPIQVKWWAVGTHMAWNCGAGPRLLLAHMPLADASAALRQPVALTDRSETHAASILGRLDDVRRRGWEVTVDDVTVGLSALAVPIRTERDQVAALSLGALTGRLLDDRGVPVHVGALVDAAGEISGNLRRHST